MRSCNRKGNKKEIVVEVVMSNKRNNVGNGDKECQSHMNEFIGEVHSTIKKWLLKVPERNKVCQQENC